MEILLTEKSEMKKPIEILKDPHSGTKSCGAGGPGFLVPEPVGEAVAKYAAGGGGGSALATGSWRRR
jgi:hypothetical protein